MSSRLSCIHPQSQPPGFYWGLYCDSHGCKKYKVDWCHGTAILNESLCIKCACYRFLSKHFKSTNTETQSVHPVCDSMTTDWTTLALQSTIYICYFFKTNLFCLIFGRLSSAPPALLSLLSGTTGLIDNFICSCREEADEYMTYPLCAGIEWWAGICLVSLTAPSWTHLRPSAHTSCL